MMWSVMARDAGEVEAAPPSLASPLAGRSSTPERPAGGPAKLGMKYVHALAIAILLVCLCLQSARASGPTTAPAVDTATLDAELRLTGTTTDGVYAVEVPRKDLHLTIDGSEAPIAAGIASHFYFYTCPCGKTRVIGEFVLCDYETDDVVDALHDGWLIKIDAIAPMLNDEKPRLRIVRFHGEGSADEIAKRIHNALNQTGDARTK